jgi:GTPase
LRADGVDPITFYFYVGSTIQPIIITPPTSAWVYYKIENVICATNTTVQLDASGPYQFYIDNIWLVAGATAY